MTESDRDERPSQSPDRNQKLALLATGGGVALVCLAVVLTLVVGARERQCKPLQIDFEIRSQTNPETGEEWDRASEKHASPDPVGWIKVTTDGREYHEVISKRTNRYEFRGNFFATRGVPLNGGSTIEVSLLDRDQIGAEGIGEINHSVWLAGSGSARSDNGVLDIAYTCRSE